MKHSLKIPEHLAEEQRRFVLLHALHAGAIVQSNVRTYELPETLRIYAETISHTLKHMQSEDLLVRIAENHHQTAAAKQHLENMKEQILETTSWFEISLCRKVALHSFQARGEGAAPRLVWVHTRRYRSPLAPHERRLERFLR
jgi:hypothetical protein